MVELASFSPAESSAVECRQVAAGPFGRMLLADINSDVPEIERRLGGDGPRSPPFIKNLGDTLHRGMRQPIRALDLVASGERNNL